jgi:phosphoribosylformylglycinamidine synthase subunit PurS
VKFDVLVDVSLQRGLLDPQGKAIEDALPTMGWTNVSNVRVGKSFQFVVEAETEADALRVAEDMGHRLLANPVIEDFRVVAVHPAARVTIEDAP